MSKKGEYTFSQSSTRADILDVIQKLEADALDEAKEHAYKFFCSNDPVDARRAAEFEGKREILASLRWAFSGEAEADGCESRVDIY